MKAELEKKKASNRMPQHMQIGLISFSQAYYVKLFTNQVLFCPSTPPQRARLQRAWGPAASVRPVWVPIFPRVATTQPITATISWRTTRLLLPRWLTSSSATTLSSSPAAPPPRPPLHLPHLPPLDSVCRGWSGAFHPHWKMTCTFTLSVALM